MTDWVVLLILLIRIARTHWLRIDTMEMAIVYLASVRMLSKITCMQKTVTSCRRSVVYLEDTTLQAVRSS